MALGRDQDMFEESQMRAREKEEENRDDKEEVKIYGAVEYERREDRLRRPCK